MNEIQKQLLDAISKGEIKKVRVLLEQGADPNGIDDDMQWTPLTVAIENEQIEIIKLLLSSGAEINRRSKYGQSPLHIAVDISIDGTYQAHGKYGDEPIDIISYLLQQGADKNATDKDGKTPIDWALEYKSDKIVKLLKEFKP